MYILYNHNNVLTIGLKRSVERIAQTPRRQTINAPQCLPLLVCAFF